MSDVISNPERLVAILHDGTGNLWAVIPAVIEAKEGEDLEWVVLPSHLDVTVKFSPSAGSPFSWPEKNGHDRQIKGTVQPGKAPWLFGSKDYKYTVTDKQGNTIDPHVRIRK
jgi:hypothetical protein